MIDEVAGQLVTLIAAPVTWQSLLLGFILFRGFDIVKPPPIRHLERLPEGIGIVIDDVGAGLYGLVVMQLSLHFGAAAIIGRQSRVRNWSSWEFPTDCWERKTSMAIPHIEAVHPGAALPGGEVRIIGKSLRPHELRRPRVRFGEVEGAVVISSDDFLIARVPAGASSGPVVVSAN